MIKKGVKGLFILLIAGFALYLYLQSSPLSSMYYFNKGKQLYDNKQYEDSIKFFEHSLSTDTDNSASRYFLALALSKSAPTYENQKALYEIANSKIHDAAQSYAKTQIILLKQKLLEGIGDNYIYSAILNKDIMRWNLNSFPLKIYFEPSDDTPKYYQNSIKQAMSEWSTKLNFVSFREVFDPKDCNIYIKFKDYDGVPCTDSTCNFTAATTGNETGKNNQLKRMIITFYKTNPAGKNFSKNEIYNTAIHETGHALGITGHSDNPEDIMYSNNHEFSRVTADGKPHLSLRDLNTLVLLYRLAPSFTDKEDKQNQNLYYPPLILGNDEEILSKKLEEYLAYIEKYPDYSGGYINISSIYASMGKDEAAFKALSKAENLSTNEDERYLIQYNRAVLYYNKQDFQTALTYANQAKQIKNEENVNELINEIHSILNSSK